MAQFVTFSYVVAVAGGYVACWYTKDKAKALITSIKAKIADLKAKL